MKHFKPLFLDIFMVKMVHLSILCWAKFCMKYCINAAWHGGHQSVVLLRCNGSAGCFDNGLISALLGLVSHLPLDNLLSSQASLLANQAQ